MKVSQFADPRRPEQLRQQVASARQQIESAPADECFINGDTRQWLRRPDHVLQAEVGRHGRLSMVSVEDGKTVVLKSETLRKNTAGWQAAAGAVAGLVGSLLVSAGSEDGRPGVGGALTGLLLGGAAAWGVGQVAEKQAEELITRVESDATGVTTERLFVHSDGSTEYSQNWKSLTKPAPLDPQAVKEYIDNLPLG